MIDRQKARLILDTCPNPGWFNMAADQYLIDTQSDSPLDYSIRFYTWNPPAISLGKHQTLDSIDLDFCRESGWDIVQRPTGGRALLHLNDLSYSVIAAVDEDSLPLLYRIYSSAAKAISTAITQIGIATTYQDSVKGSIRKLSFRNRACLSSLARGEVLANGMKVACAAQRMYRDAVLQHGSILLTGDTAVIAPALKVEWYDQIQLAERLHTHSRSLEDISGTKPDIEQLIDKLRAQFAFYLNLDFTAISWSSEEISAINRYRKDFDLFSCSTAAEMTAFE